MYTSHNSYVILLSAVLLLTICFVGCLRAQEIPDSTNAPTQNTEIHADSVEDVEITQQQHAPATRGFLGYLSQAAAFFLTFVPIMIAAWFAYRRWRLSNFTDRWYRLVEFLHEHPEYMDIDNNKNYHVHYSDYRDKWKYESVARMCIAYVDDCYFLFNRRHFDNWFSGVIPLLVGRHYRWFLDNEDSYAESFVNYVKLRIQKLPASKVAI